MAASPLTPEHTVAASPLTPEHTMAQQAALSDTGGQALTGQGKPGSTGHRARLRHRFMTGGPDAMPDDDLLELLLCLAIPRRDVKGLARALLARFGSYAAVIAAPHHQLQDVSGVGASVISALKLIEASAIRLARGRIMDQPVLGSWTAVLDYLKITMDFKQEETFRVLFLDRGNSLIFDHVQQTGTIDHTAVYPREIIKHALSIGAAALILVHNHPSGDPTPSPDDITLTRDIVRIAESLDIRVHDHVIIGGGKHVSFKSEGYL